MNKITTEDLRRMKDSEGLILQGCGGDLNEWVGGINELLTEAGILQDDTKLDADKVSTFQNEGLTNLLFPFTDDVQLDIGKLALWRLQTHEQFGGTWLSDYICNKLGGYQTEASKNRPKQQKPDCALIGEDGNIFNLMVKASRTLKENGLQKQAKTMCSRVTMSGNYYNALSVISEYVNVTSKADDSEEGYYGKNNDYDEDEKEGMELG